MTPVTSSNIDAIGYEPETQVLKVRFHTGITYAYGNVSHQQFTTLINAESVGKSFNQLIKSRPDAHPFTRLP